MCVTLMALPVCCCSRLVGAHTQPTNTCALTCMLAGPGAVRPAALCSRAHLLAGPQHPYSPHQPGAAIWATQRLSQAHHSHTGLQGPQAAIFPWGGLACAAAGVPASWGAVTAADQLLCWGAGSRHAACWVSAVTVPQEHWSLAGCRGKTAVMLMCVVVKAPACK